MFQKILKLIKRHKIIAGVIIIALAVGGYYGHKTFSGSKNSIRYVTAAVEKGTLISSVSGSGQISASSQMDLKPKASGYVVYVGVKSGQEVKSGTLLVKIDDADAQKTVANAQTSYDQAKIKLEKMQGLTTEAGILRGIKEKAEDDLSKSYEDGFNTVSNAFLNLPTVMNGFNTIFFSNTLSKNQQNTDWYVDQVSALEGGSKAVTYKNDFNSSYQTAKDKYDEVFNYYKSTSRNSDTQTIESLISETYEATKLIADTVKKAINYIDFVYDLMNKSNISIPSTIPTYQSNLDSYTGTTNTYLSGLLSAKDTIQSNKEALIETDYTITDQETAVKQAASTLVDAKTNLVDYYVYAPFDGIIAEVDVEKGDSASSGTTVATIITKQQTAEISLNEVDAAKIKLGQKATLTFDAINGLSLTGKVAAIDAIGTVSQGVVTYNVKIIFDTQDERIKPGMSVSAAIITDSKQNVLVISSSAIKQQNNSNYVEILVNGAPQQQSVETGISNDTNTEIINGLKENDQIITQTIASTAATKTQSQSSAGGGVRIPGLGGGFGR